MGLCRLFQPAALFALLLPMGCKAVPNSGPDDREIAKQATVHYQSPDKPLSGLNYLLVDLSSDFVDRMAVVKPVTFSRGFGASRSARPALPLGIGDVVQLSLFESSAGGLFIPEDAGSRPGNYITLPSQTIQSDGMLKVPYAGNVAAAGRPVADVQAEVERRLASRAIEPQAVITIQESKSSQVSVLGDVRNGTRLSLDPGGERVLDAISRAGGLSSPGAETNITLQRRGTTATVLFDELVANPKENIFLYPGDIIYANRERRTFLAFGASGLNGRIDFEESDLTLAEAVGKAGGLLDSRADPGQVFIYRQIPSAELSRLGLSPPAVTRASYPVIFRANMRNPSAFFLAQNFPMADKDILYVSNADMVEVTKFLQFINNVSAGTAGPISDVATGRDAVESIGH